MKESKSLFIIKEPNENQGLKQEKKNALYKFSTYETRLGLKEVVNILHRGGVRPRKA